MSENKTTVTIVVPAGYASAEEFCKDCGVEPAYHLREAIWVAIHSAIDAPAEQITMACGAVMEILNV